MAGDAALTHSVYCTPVPFSLKDEGKNPPGDAALTCPEECRSVPFRCQRPLFPAKLYTALWPVPAKLCYK
ncbi:hypothetical protein ACP26F_09665 [Franconibacter pulveris 1160]|uniref:hypothetical protein n=1 Tax=Franconibacter pulveris TaxID=435910 RepID=UPI000467E7DA|nr:hypothetical protein [Franconibacter pulveris]